MRVSKERRHFRFEFLYGNGINKDKKIYIFFALMVFKCKCHNID